MLRTWKSAWKSVRSRVRLVTMLVCAIFVFLAALAWRFDTLVDGRSLVLGSLVSGVYVYLLLSQGAAPDSEDARAEHAERERLNREHTRADTDCSIWLARCARLECRMMRRRLREGERYDPRDD
jgi:hypothetical protein